MPAVQGVTRQAKVFVSYSQGDLKYRNRLIVTLEALKNLGIIQSYWYDDRIEPAQEWSREIEEKLQEADIVLLLVSDYFLASDYCYNIETPAALDLHDKKLAFVIPIIVRAFSTTKLLRFYKLQSLPKGLKPVNRWKPLDDAYQSIGQGIRIVAEKVSTLSKYKAAGAPAIAKPKGRRPKRGGGGA